MQIEITETNIRMPESPAYDELYKSRITSKKTCIMDLKNKF